MLSTYIQLGPPASANPDDVATRVTRDRELVPALAKPEWAHGPSQKEREMSGGQLPPIYVGVKAQATRPEVKARATRPESMTYLPPQFEGGASYPLV